MSKRILFILVVLALAWSTTADVQAKSKKEGRFSGQTAMQVAKLMYPGWNLGNTMEAGSNTNSWKSVGVSTETAWQKTTTTKELINFIKVQGFKSVRIPCACVMGHITDTHNCTIDPQWMARVKEIVSYCVDADLYVVLNQHWDGGCAAASHG